MNKIVAFLKFLIVFGLFQFFLLTAIAQEKTDNAVLTNNSIVELVKAGLSERIITAKIKGSKTEFDTSAVALTKLKESGVSEELILVMIEAKPKVIEEPKENSKSENQKTAEMKEAVGKRKIFLITEDEESRIELIKKLTSKGFSFVDNRTLADLLLELTYAEGSTQRKVGIFKGGSETEFKTKIGKLVVKLNRNSTEYLIYAREYDYAKAANTAAIFGISAAPPSLRDQVKYYFVDDFLRQMKKAGDKIK